jgi:DNA-binding transcriptional LysR family regulator
MDRFEAMRAFARVVETGSFTRAAHTLQISRTTVTQLVQQLEAHLRLRLLNRTTRRVSVTADGAAYYPRIARLLAELEEVEGGLGDAAAQPRGRLRVDVPGPYARLRLVPALPDFQARYPEIQLDIGVSDREVDVIADNVDCVIRGGTPADPALVARPLAALPIGFHASPAMCSVSACRPIRARWKGPTTTWSASSARAVAGRVFSAQRGDERVEVQGRYTVGFDDGNAYLAAALAGWRGGAAQLHGRTARGARRAAAGVAGLAAAADADACDVPAEPAHEPAAAGVH